jgi:hypothetical protein
MRALPIAALLLAATLAVAAPASATIVYCNGPSGSGVVGQVIQHGYDQCNDVLNAVLGGRGIVRSLLDAVDASCVFLTGGTCVP